MKINAAVLFGGRSVEHEVSVISALQAIMSMDREKYNIIPVYITKQNEMYTGEAAGDISSYSNIPELLKKLHRVVFVNSDSRVWMEEYPKKLMSGKPVAIDVAFPIVHGTNVEDGALQGYLRILGLPFVGCDVTASGLGMDKYFMKCVLKEAGVPVLDCLLFTTSDYGDIDAIVEKVKAGIPYPVIVKPANLGSSVGIAVAKDDAALKTALDDAFRYASRVLVEPAITALREINCAVLGDAEEAVASECEEPRSSDEILSYRDKYMSGGKKTGSKGMAGVARQIPADIPPGLREEIRTLAVRAFKALDCCGVARIDFMLDVNNDLKLYFNEINTIPGSLSFYLWEPLDKPYRELLDEMIALAFKRERRNSGLTFSFDSNILNAGTLKGLKGTKGKG